MSQVSSAKAAVPLPRQKLERLLSADEVAEFLGIPVATLYQWRHKGCGPEAYRVGRHLRYDPLTVRAWLDEHLEHRRGVG
jgi:excisionase family DNA binding protein